MDEFNDENEDETSLKHNMHIFNERKHNVKDFNIEGRVQRIEHRELLLLVAGVLHHLCAVQAASILKSRKRCTILTVGDFGGLKLAKHITLFRNNFEHIGNVELYRKFYVRFLELNHTIAIRDYSLTEDQNS